MSTRGQANEIGHGPAGTRAVILFFNVPAHGHINPTLPVVSELASRGHRIIYYSTEPFRAEIERTAAEFRSYQGSQLTGAELARHAGTLVRVTLFLLDESIRLLPFVLNELDRERPELVIFDSIALWGMQAAHLRRLPTVASISTLVLEGVSGMMTGRDYLHLLRQAIPVVPSLLVRRRELVKKYGPEVFPRRSIFPCTGQVSLVYTPRGFQPHTPFIDPSFHFVGPSILPATRAAPDFPWNELDQSRPCVYLSLGTIYHGATTFYRTAFSAFADHPGQFVLSIGHERNLQGLGPIPPNFIVRVRVPQLDLLQRTGVFVTHGGMNSVSEALYFGVPLVVIPQQLEQVLNGRQVAKSGAGILVADSPPYGRVDAAALRAAVERVLHVPQYADSARRLRESCQAAGGYKEAASIIESVLTRSGSRVRDV